MRQDPYPTGEGISEAYQAPVSTYVAKGSRIRILIWAQCLQRVVFIEVYTIQPLGPIYIGHLCLVS